MVSDVTWKIHTKSNDIYPAQFDVSGPSEINRGDGATFSFEFGGGIGNDLTVNDSYTVQSNDSEIYADITVKSGATLTVNGTLRADTLTVDGTVDVNGTLIVNENTFGAFSSYREWAGKFDIKEMLDGTTRYDDFIPSGEDIDTLVVGIEPSEDLQNSQIVGIWGIIRNLSDNRNNALTINRYRMDVTVLGEYSDYSDHTDIENKLRL